MVTSRVPSGVPTGGQFAASARSEADISLVNTAAGSPVSDTSAVVTELADIDEVRATVDLLDVMDHEQVEAAARAALPHLPPRRAAVLERTITRHEEVSRRDGEMWAPMRSSVRETLYADLVDATQDVPTKERLAELKEDARQARVAVTNAYIARDIGTGTEADIEQAIRHADELDAKVVGADALRERATMRRIFAGKPTVLDARETQDRYSDARDALRTARNNADRARANAHAAPGNAERWGAATAAAQEEKAAEAEYSRLQSPLVAINQMLLARRRREGLA